MKTVAMSCMKSLFEHVEIISLNLILLFTQQLTCMERSEGARRAVLAVGSGLSLHGADPGGVVREGLNLGEELVLDALVERAGIVADGVGEGAESLEVSNGWAVSASDEALAVLLESADCLSSWPSRLPRDSIEFLRLF